MAGQIIPRGKNKYLVRVYLGEVNGKRKYHSKTIYGGKKAAEAYLTKILREKHTGIFLEPSKELLGAYLDGWMKSVVKQRVSGKTYKSYEQLINLYIKPELESVKLCQLAPEQIQQLYSKMIDRGLSPRTVRYTHTVLRNALQQAVKWGKIYRNPADLVKDDLPKQERKEMRAFTPEEAARFMEAIIYSPLKALFSLLLASGMRPGEALGLKWSDIDFKGKRVTVRRALVRIRGDRKTEKEKGWKLCEPKTAKSRRTIPIPADVINDLDDHRKAQAAQKLKAKPGTYDDRDFVFAGNNGEPLFERNVNHEFKAILKAAGLPDIRLYDLRHSCATLLLAAGENPKVVSERLGHASITLTLDTYSHVLPDMQQGASDKLQKILFGGKSGQ